MRLYQTSTSLFTRPNNATAYAIKDMVSNSVGATVPMSWNIPNGFLLTGVRTFTNDFLVQPALNLHLYQFSPTNISGDNLVYSTDSSGYLGYIFIDTNSNQWASFNDFRVGFSPVDPNLIPLFTDTTSDSNGPINKIYGLFQTTIAFGPTAQSVWGASLVGVD